MDKIKDALVFVYRAIKAGLLNLPRRFTEQMSSLAMVLVVLGGFTLILILFVFLGGHFSFWWASGLIVVGLLFWEGVRLMDHPDHW